MREAVSLKEAASLLPKRPTLFFSALKEESGIALTGVGGPTIGDEAPQEERLRGNLVVATDFFNHIVADFFGRGPDDTGRERVGSDAGATSEEMTTAQRTIGVDGHTIGAGGEERLAIGHGGDDHLSTFGLAQVYGVADAGRGVEVVGGGLEALPVFLFVGGIVAEEEHVVGGAVHLRGPSGIAFFEIVLDFGAGHLDDVKAVFVFVEVEHVAHGDGALGDFGIEGEGGGEGDVGSAHFELHLVDEIDKGRGAEEGGASAHRGFVAADDLGGVGFDGFKLFLEAGHEIGIGLLVVDADQGTGKALLDHALSGIAAHTDVGLGHVFGVVAGIEDERLLAGHLVGNPAVGQTVVMSAEDDVDVGHLLGNLVGGVFEHGAAGTFLTYSAVHQDHHDVGLTGAAHNGDHAAGIFELVSKLEARPGGGGNLLRDGGCDETEETDLHTVYLLHGVGGEITLLGSDVAHIGTEHRESTVVHPAIVDAVPGLDVVVAGSGTHGFEVVDHGGSEVG